ncbi:hypothetical protein FRC09_018521 [Ceratobasidium sp. 395]|nr:hypothetical protein FRC09_018521 [Ceratobasidium sp. 395]
MGNSYYQYHTHTGQLSDLDLGIQHSNQAISLLPEDHPGQAETLSDLGNMYSTRYKQLGELEDLNRAIDCKRSAISKRPDESSDKPTMLVYLGQFLENRYKRSNSLVDIFESMNCFKQAAHSLVGEPDVRNRAAFQWGRLLFVHEDPESSLEAFQYFMWLIPQVVWLGLATSSRYNHASRVANLTLEAATAAAVSGSFKRALEWLEQGRSVVWNQLLQLRSPLDALQTVDASLATDILGVANELQNAASLKPSVEDLVCNPFLAEQFTQRHRRLTENWERLTARAQSLPGMNSFLAPKKASELVESAYAGAVVVVIIHDRICSALIIPPGSSKVIFVHLEGVSRDKLARAYSEIKSNNKEQARAQIRGIKQSKPRIVEHSGVLNMLWIGIAKPVLDALGYT